VWYWEGSDHILRKLLCLILKKLMVKFWKKQSSTLKHQSAPLTHSPLAVVKPLLKKDNLDGNILSNYRPISNLPFISKIIVFNQLNKFLILNGYFDSLSSFQRIGIPNNTPWCWPLPVTSLASCQSSFLVFFTAGAS